MAFYYNRQNRNLGDLRDTWADRQMQADRLAHEEKMLERQAVLTPESAPKGAVARWRAGVSHTPQGGGGGANANKTDTATLTAATAGAALGAPTSWRGGAGAPSPIQVLKGMSQQYAPAEGGASYLTPTQAQQAWHMQKAAEQGDYRDESGKPLDPRMIEKMHGRFVSPEEHKAEVTGEAAYKRAYAGFYGAKTDLYENLDRQGREQALVATIKSDPELAKIGFDEKTGTMTTAMRRAASEAEKYGATQDPSKFSKSDFTDFARSVLKGHNVIFSYEKMRFPVGSSLAGQNVFKALQGKAAELLENPDFAAHADAISAFIRRKGEPLGKDAEWMQQAYNMYKSPMKPTEFAEPTMPNIEELPGMVWRHLDTGLSTPRFMTDATRAEEKRLAEERARLQGRPIEPVWRAER